MNAWFDSETFAQLRARRGISWGERLDVHDVTASTNDCAFEAARQGTAEGAVFVAGRQTAGRGRRGNRWLAPPGENLTFSLLLRPERSLVELSQLPLVVGLAVREVVASRLSSMAREALVKWPNDVLVGSRKIAGILVESRLREGDVSVTVVGIGLNVLTARFEGELAGSATSLSRERASIPKEHALEELLVELLDSLERRFVRFCRDGLESFLPELSVTDALRGRRVRIGEVTGEALGIGDAGELLVLDDAGARHALSAGHVEILASRQSRPDGTA